MTTTGKEIHEYLVRLGLEAFERSSTAAAIGSRQRFALIRAAFEVELRERMAQAAQMIVLDLDTAREGARRPSVFPNEGESP